jgi:hypothetical protein
MANKRIRRQEGQVVRIDLGQGAHAFARVLGDPLFAFYDKLFKDDHGVAVDEIVQLPVAFKIWVANSAVTKGIWPIVGNLPLTADLSVVPAFFKQDALSGRISIHKEVPEWAPTYERPASITEVRGLERAAVWDPIHVEDRLRDHFAGEENKWVKSLAIDPARAK